MAPRSELIPAAPFAQWLNQRFGELAAQEDSDLNSACVRLAKELGWTDVSVEAGERKLYRFRKQMRAGSRIVKGKVKKGDFPTEVFSRQVVVEALHHAGVPLGDVYPYEAVVDEFQMEYDVPLSEARRLADAWIEQAWTSVWEREGRYQLPAQRPSHYCGACKRTTKRFVGVCEECMAPVNSVLRAVA
jgi:hypothetical protein